MCRRRTKIMNGRQRGIGHYWAGERKNEVAEERKNGEWRTTIFSWWKSTIWGGGGGKKNIKKEPEAIFTGDNMTGQKKAFEIYCVGERNRGTLKGKISKKRTQLRSGNSKRSYQQQTKLDKIIQGRHPPKQGTEKDFVSEKGKAPLITLEVKVIYRPESGGIFH